VAIVAVVELLGWVAVAELIRMAVMVVVRSLRTLQITVG
jgi:hypothetical protein